MPGRARRGLCVPIIRPKTFIGTGRLGVFQILYDWVYSGKRIPIIGNGANRYQLLEVDDLVEAIRLAATAPAAASQRHLQCRRRALRRRAHRCRRVVRVRRQRRARDADASLAGQARLAALRGAAPLATL